MPIRLRQLTSQIHVLKQDNGYKDQRILELSEQVKHLKKEKDHAVNNYNNIRENEQTLINKCNEYQNKIVELNNSLHIATELELNLRNSLSYLQQDKLNIERNNTILLGNLEGTVANLNSELENKENIKKKLEYELSICKRELERKDLMYNETIIKNQELLNESEGTTNTLYIFF